MFNTNLLIPLNEFIDIYNYYLNFLYSFLLSLNNQAQISYFPFRFIIHFYVNLFYKLVLINFLILFVGFL